MGLCLRRPTSACSARAAESSVAPVIDLKLLRENPDVVRASQRARGEDPGLVDALLDSDAARRAAVSSGDNLRAEQKAASKKVGKASPDERPVLLDTVGEPRAIDNPKDHVELGESLGLIDLERGAKVSGARFYFLTGAGALLQLGLLQLAARLATENGFTLVIPPVLVRPEIMAGTGFLGAHSEEVYRLEADDLYLVGTSEGALAGYHSGEILDLSDGPLRYAGWSACYRREAGSYGKDTRGIIRVHQFHKVEAFVYTTVEDAAEEH